MTGSLRIAPTTLSDFEIAIEWAANEGWNPGLDDAVTMYGVDPGGFLMGWIGDRPVTAISVVRHSDRFGFLGFYLCHPDFRGQGFGWQTWQAGMAYLGDRVVGLDGVPAQEANYRTSGFALAHHTRRYAGSIAGCMHPHCRLATLADMPRLLQMDRDVSSVDRSSYLSGWLTQTPTRQTMVSERGGQITGLGTIRACREGHKIGPLFAPDADTALRLIQALVIEVAAYQIQLDIPDPNRMGVDLAGGLGLAPVFSCARMYRGEQLNRRLACIFGEATFELG